VGRRPGMDFLEDRKIIVSAGIRNRKLPVSSLVTISAMLSWRQTNYFHPTANKSIYNIPPMKQYVE